MEGVLSRVAPLKAAFAAALVCACAISPASAIEAYVFRGMGDFSFIARGLTFSDGMDRLAEKIDHSGVRARSYRWQEADAVYREIMARQPDAVAIMGHSAGAVASLAVAERLKGSGIRVAYLGLIDIPGPVGALPRNVEVAENYFHAWPVFGQLHTLPGHKGPVVNQYVTGEIHVTMDNSRRVHEAMISAVWAADQAGRARNLQAFAADASVRGVEQALAPIE
jgi:pimeloyl-ACP methyl ester carboxylesterase